MLVLPFSMLIQLGVALLASLVGAALYSVSTRGKMEDSIEEQMTHTLRF